MDLIRVAINKPVAVAVAVLLTVLFGILSLTAIPVQLTPNVDSTVITVSTFWEGANPQEVERDIIEKQEEKLKGLSGLRKMTSTSQQSNGTITLEFYVGMDKEAALREVSDKLREVPDYPENVDEPIITDGNPRNRDYIAWIIFETTDDDLDIRSQYDFAEDRIKPVLERAYGVAEVNVLGGREKEMQVRVHPLLLAQRSLTYGQLITALRRENVNVSAGTVDEGKSSIRVRTVGRFESVEQIEKTIIAYTDGGPVRVEDVADVQQTFKEPTSFVRSKGRTVIAINVQREIGTNVMQVMDSIKEEINRLNQPGGLLDTYALSLGINGTFRLHQVYDQTVYIEDAIMLVRNNIFIGGALAVLILIIFLRSWRSVGIIALAIPISIIGTFVAMVSMGRNLNVISLAGLAFAVGMVVDNAIVVLENIFRHIEEGQSPARAAYYGAREVWGAVLASTLTTVVVFVPILFIEEEAGQLFRDITLAICAAVLLSLVVSITVIPSASRLLLKGNNKHKKLSVNGNNQTATINHLTLQNRKGFSAMFARIIHLMCGSVLIRLGLVAVFAAAAITGSYFLMPPTDYLPAGNRNLVFGFMIPPPGYSLDKMYELAFRVEHDMQPYWQPNQYIDDPEAYAKAVEDLPVLQTSDPMGNPLPPFTPPPIENYFFVAFNGMMFHGGISEEPARVRELQALMGYATRQENMNGVLAFAFQAPLFNISGSAGISIDVEFVGDNMDEVVSAAQAAFMQLATEYGYGAVQPSPGNFAIPGPELRIIVDRIRAADLGLTTSDIGTAVRAISDGAFVGEYRASGESIDLVLIDANAVGKDGKHVQRNLDDLGQIQIATPAGKVVPLGSIARIIRTTAPQQINHVEERRAVILEFAPPPTLPLEAAMVKLNEMIASMRQAGTIATTVDTQLSGTADKLSAVRNALLGDGTLLGLLGSRLFLSLLVVYLLMCVLFESFLYPFVILLSVPMATVGGFLALAGMHYYIPEQKLDVLTMLGFVILIGVVVNNAILIVHQSLNFMRGIGDDSVSREVMAPRMAIAESVRTRLRPIMMSTLTSIGGMAPLVFMPGAGSELYRGLGSVIIGGLFVSTLFTLVLVPLLFSLVIDLKIALGGSVAMRKDAMSNGK